MGDDQEIQILGLPSELDLDLVCEEEELSPAQIAAQDEDQKKYERATGLVQNWRKNKRKLESYTTEGLVMYHSTPIILKAVKAVPPAQQVSTSTSPLKLVSQSVNNVRPMISGNSSGTILVQNNYSSPGIIRQNRPIQITSLAPTSIRPQISQSPITIRTAGGSANLNGTAGGNQLHQFIFDANSGLLIVPPQTQNSRMPTTTVNTASNVRPAARMIYPASGSTNSPGGTLIRRPIATTQFSTPTTSTTSASTIRTYQASQTPKIVSSTSLSVQNKPRIQLQQPRAPTAASVASTNKGATVNGVQGTGSSVTSTGSDPNNRTFPSLVVTVKPCLHDKPTKNKLNESRTDLDARVKNLLIYQSSKFTEWLMQEGLLKLEHKCTQHLSSDKQPVPYKLGMYSDGNNKQPFSGGYVWISSCCQDKQITVFQGSIFEASIYPPGTLLKLIYHWSCQTAATNVLTWVKVTSYYLKNFYTLLRSACVAALHEFCPIMGGKSKFVEVGIITLGTSTSTQAAGQKQIKVEILGVFDPTTKVIRMKVINPQNVGVNSANHSRVMQILWPLNHWVDKASIILIDSSIEKNLLLEMGFKNVHQCKNSNPSGTPKSSIPTNVNVMNYLKHVVPKMFQNTLCVLSKSLIQQFLDELSWRELWGETPSATFDQMIKHLVAMTKWETGESLISRLNRISLNPFGEWSYSRGKNRTGIEMLPDSILGSNGMPELSAQAPITSNAIKLNSNGTVAMARAKPAQINRNSAANTVNKPPILTPQVTALGQGSGPLKRKLEPTIEIDLNRHYLAEPKTLILQSYYYADCSGNPNPTIGDFPANLKCPLCSKLFISNLEVIRHIFMHVQSMGIRPSNMHSFCEYCLKDVGPVGSLQCHVNDVHKMVGVPFACLICQEKFTSETTLTLHMWESHGKYEMPYKCESCDYRSSFHHEVVSHFTKEHTGTDAVLCPLCLKVLSAKSFSCMKQIVVHLQSHTIRKGKKCPQCVLTFNGDLEFRAHAYESTSPHQADDAPTSGTLVPFQTHGTGEIKMARPPKVKRLTVPPQMPPLKKAPRLDIQQAGTGGTIISNARKQLLSGQSRTQFQGEGTQFDFHEMSIQFINSKVLSSKCMECHRPTGNEDHYPGYMVCLKCRFATCCRAAMITHTNTVHAKVGDIKHMSSLKTNPAEVIDPIYCGCGFEAKNGIKMAQHLISCGKLSACLEYTEGSTTGIPNQLLDQLGLTRNN